MVIFNSYVSHYQRVTCNSAIRRPRRLPSTLMFDHPTTKAIATFAAEQLATVVSDAWILDGPEHGQHWSFVIFVGLLPTIETTMETTWNNINQTLKKGERTAFFCQSGIHIKTEFTHSKNIHMAMDQYLFFYHIFRGMNIHELPSGKLT